MNIFNRLSGVNFPIKQNLIVNLTLCFALMFFDFLMSELVFNTDTHCVSKVFTLGNTRKCKLKFCLFEILLFYSPSIKEL